MTIKYLSNITSSASSICSLIKFIDTHSIHLDIINTIKELDIDTDIEGTDILLKELQPRLAENVHTQSLAFHIKKIHDCICDMERLLLEIHEKIGYNKKLLIAYNWRSYKFDNEIINIRNLKTILRQRKFDLFEIIKINIYLKPYIHNEKKIECLDESMILL